MLKNICKTFEWNACENRYRLSIKETFIWHKNKECLILDSDWDLITYECLSFSYLFLTAM